MLVLGCTAEQHEPMAMAELGPVTLEMFIGRSVAQVAVKYRPEEAPWCAVMRPDFEANVSGVAGSMYPGEMEDGRCYEPFADFYDWGLIEHAMLEIGDASRTIRCDLKDAFAPRRLVRVDKETWDVVRGERVTVQWQPQHDITAAFLYLVWVEANRGPWYVDWRMEGDLISFVVPPVDSGMATIWMAGSEEVENANACGGVPNRQLRVYHADQVLNVK